MASKEAASSGKAEAGDGSCSSKLHVGIEKLAELEISDADVKLLHESGFISCRGILLGKKKRLQRIKGLASENIEKIMGAAQKLVNEADENSSSGDSFTSGRQEIVPEGMSTRKPSRSEAKVAAEREKLEAVKHHQAYDPELIKGKHLAQAKYGAHVKVGSLVHVEVGEEDMRDELQRSQQRKKDMAELERRVKAELPGEATSDLELVQARTGHHLSSDTWISQVRAGEEAQDPLAPGRCRGDQQVLQQRITAAVDASVGAARRAIVFAEFSNNLESDLKLIRNVCRLTQCLAVPILPESKGTDRNPFCLDALTLFAFNFFQQKNVGASAGYRMLVSYYHYDLKTRDKFEQELLQAFPCMIRAPLLLPNRQPLPQDLRAVLIEGLKLMNKHGATPKAADPKAAEWEIKVRKVVLDHDEHIRSIQVPAGDVIGDVTKQVQDLISREVCDPLPVVITFQSAGIFGALFKLQSDSIPGVREFLSRNRVRVEIA